VNVYVYEFEIMFLSLLFIAYTHRIGRTGRAGEAGLATSFLTAEDTDIMYDLKQMLQKTNNYIPQELRDHPAAQYKPGK
jgi:ATP-dependent RNA helicase DDX23/PRP28